ncbi:MAG: DUF6515 family protein [Candidatus Omnitrophica bacterium]|nr:DUF6515 family protein [Candidatus Omnitrophota bacterium]
MKNAQTATVMFLVTALLLCPVIPAQARHGHHRRYPRYGSFKRILPYALATLIIGGIVYYYRDGVYYRKHADRYVVVEPPLGAVVTNLPRGYTPIIIDGVPYFVVNNVTYMQTPQGYQVVPQPPAIVITHSLPQPASTPVAETPAAPPAAPIVVERPYPDPAPITNSKGEKIPDKYQPEIFTVNIPNARGTYTAIPLQRTGNGYLGPQGEYYSEFPTVEQLKAMYAK